MLTLIDIPLPLRVLRFAGRRIAHRVGPRYARARRWLWDREYAWYGPSEPFGTTTIRLLVNEPSLVAGRWEHALVRTLRDIYYDPAWNSLYHPEVTHDDSNGTAR